jgi:dihydroorotate dehydrogenase electron transfer subunit
MKRFDTTVTSIRQVATSYFELRFQWPEAGSGHSGAEAIRGDAPAPGRFITVKAGGLYDPVLRRPFAFAGWDPRAGGSSIIFQLRGRGTAYLAALKPGDAIDVLGPLGRGFGKPPRGARPVLVAGGVGVGPMLYLAKALAADAAAGLCEAPILAMGFRSASFVPDIELPAGTVICTDDGSAGFRGTVADWLAGFDPGLPPSYYACGPEPMMAAVDRMAAAGRAPFEAAVEQWMACGVGACAGCAVELKSGLFAKACVDGPVLDGSLVAWKSSGKPKEGHTHER